jgi:hypothetical protein
MSVFADAVRSWRLLNTGLVQSLGDPKVDLSSEIWKSIAELKESPAFAALLEVWSEPMAAIQPWDESEEDLDGEAGNPMKGSHLDGGKSADVAETMDGKSSFEDGISAQDALRQLYAASASMTQHWRRVRLADTSEEADVVWCESAMLLSGLAAESQRLLGESTLQEARSLSDDARNLQMLHHFI